MPHTPDLHAQLLLALGLPSATAMAGVLGLSGRRKPNLHVLFALNI